MVNLRKNNDVLVYGDYELIELEHPDIYAYVRTLGPRRMMVLLNFSARKSSIELPDASGMGDVLINNFETVDVEKNKVFLTE